MKDKFIKYFMDVAIRTSELSYAKRLKVGCIVVKEDRIISIGYNGTPKGWNNNCEDILENGELKTKDSVIHAERNAIAKLARSNESAEKSVMFITCSPCLTCAEYIALSGIEEIYYKDVYRCSDGLEYLKKHGVKIAHV